MERVCDDAYGVVRGSETHNDFTSSGDVDQEKCMCGTAITPCTACGDERCYNCDSHGSSDCDDKLC